MLLHGRRSGGSAALARSRILRHAVAMLVLALCALGAAAREGSSILVADLPYVDAGPDDPRTLDLYVIDQGKRRPVVIFVHGGGWAFGDKADVGSKPGFFLAQGMAFVSINYRLRWDYRVSDQAADLASAIRWVVDRGGRHGLDAERIVLLGYEAGAHLVSLVGTDPRYLGAVGLAPRDLRVVAAAAGIAYDLPAFMSGPATFLQKRHLSLVFGSEPEALAQASPARHVAPGQDLPSFALLYPAEDSAAQGQANAFGRLLSQSKGGAITIPIHPRETLSAEAVLGMPDDPSSLALLTFIQARL
jgi:acetyl esterase/lipase